VRSADFHERADLYFPVWLGLNLRLTEGTGQDATSGGTLRR
jgi:hypothetical protein